MNHEIRRQSKLILDARELWERNAASVLVQIRCHDNELDEILTSWGSDLSTWFFRPHKYFSGSAPIEVYLEDPTKVRNFLSSLLEGNFV